MLLNIESRFGAVDLAALAAARDIRRQFGEATEVADGALARSAHGDFA